MKRKFWVVLLTVLTALCLCFGFAACEKEESGGNTGDGSQTEQPGGSQGGSQTEQPGGTQGGSQTEQPGGSQSGSQTEQPGGSQSGNQGNQGSGTQKPNEGQGGGTTKPDDDPGGSQEKPEEPPTKETDFTFTQVGNGFAVTAYSGTETRLVVPAEHEGKPVTAIASRAFYDGAFTSITLPASLKEIGGGAFGYCTKLQSIEIPNCARIGDSAFIGCAALQEITLPQDTIFLGSSLFQYCNALNKVTLNGGTVKSATFLGAEKLTEIVLGKDVTSVAQNAFAACKNLRKLTMPRVEADVSFMSYYFNVTPETYTLKKTETILSGLPDDIFPDEVDSYRFGNQVYGIPRSNTSWYYYGNSIRVGDKTYTYSGKPITVLAWQSCYEMTVGVYYSVPKQWTATFYHYPETSLEELTITEQQISIYDKTFHDCACDINILKKFPVKSLNITGTTECFIDELLPENYVLYIQREDGFKETYPLFDYISEQDKSALQKVGTHKLTVTYEGQTCSITITVKLHTFDNAKLDSKEFYFDGSSHSLEVTGAPEGTQITYQNNGKSEAGEYTVTATLTKQYYETKTLTATLNIMPSFYEIHYVLGLDGVTNENLTSYKTDGENVKLKDPVRPGYEFLGWYTEADFQNKITEIKGNAHKSYTLYAKWQSVFILDGSQITGLTEYGKQQTELVIDETINGTKITSIGEKAFYYNTKLQKITIPDSMTSIRKEAFLGCSGLTEITVNEKNQTYHSQGNCLIETDSKTLILGCKTSKIPDDGSVTKIGSYAFDNCSGLTSVTIPDSVTLIRDSAFAGCSGLTSVTIPDSVTSIRDSAFAGCSGLTGVYISDLSAWYKIDFWSANSNPLSYADHLYLEGAEVKNLTIPSDIKEIKAYAFYGCSGLTSVTIGSGVTSIGYEAFYHCSGLTSVTIGSGVTSIGYEAFAYCSGLTSVNIPDSVTSIGEWAFYYCSGLQSVIWNAENCTEGGRGHSVFASCKNLSRVIFGEKVKTISTYAFRDCSGLTSVTIGNGVTSIRPLAFLGCSGLTEITVNEKNQTYHSQGNCLIETDSKTLILGCKTSKIPDDGSVTSIGDSAFYDCSGLTSVTIPDSVTSIGDSAFDNCSGLTSVTIPDSVTSIGSSAFVGCSGLTSIDIPDSVTSIGYAAFFGCSGLTSVTIGSGVTEIGDRAFYHCSGLTSVTIPDSVTSIGSYAFAYCYNLQNVIFDDPSNWYYNNKPVQGLSNPAAAAQLLRQNTSYAWEKRG